MAIEGRLRELALSDVLQLLEMSRKTGTLTVYSDLRERPAVIRFERGAIVAAEVPDHEARLGNLLLRNGKLTELDMERVLRAQRANPAVPFGTLAVQLGVAGAGDVKRQLAFQIEETVFELFRWKDGQFRFEESAPQLDGVVPVRIPTQSLLMEAARRADEWETLSASIPHTGVVPVLEPGGEEAATPLDLKPQEWEVLAEIDGERSVKQIASDLGRSEFEVAKTIYGLLATHVIALVDGTQPEVHDTRPSGEWRQLFADAERALRFGRPLDAQRLLERPVAELPENAEVQLLAGQTLFALHRWHEAADTLERVVQIDPLCASAYFQLGFAAAHTGDLARAEHAWNIYLRLPDARGPRGETVRRALEAATALRAILEAETA